MQNSAGDSSTKKSLPSFLQHLPMDKPQNTDAISKSPTEDTMRTATPLQGEEVSHGEGQKERGKSSESIGTPSNVLELNSAECSDGGETGVVAKGDGLEKPMVEVGHKRKASREILIPRVKSFSIHLQDLQPNCNSQHVISSPPISTPAGQQLNDQLMPQEEGEEGNEKVKGNGGSPTRAGLEGLDLNQKIEGMEDSPDHVEQGAEVEPFVAQESEVKPSVVEEIEVEPHAAENNNEVKSSEIERNEVEPYDTTEKSEVEPYAADNNEVKPSAAEKNEVETNAAEKNEVEPSEMEEIEVEPYAAENNEVKPSAVEKNEVEPYDTTERNEVKPSATEKNEVEHSAIEKNEVVEPSAANIEVEKHEERPSTTGKNEMESSLTEKSNDFRNAKAFEFDLNELPPEEDEN